MRERSGSGNEVSWANRRHGAVLLEILIATGLLAVVTGCLLTAFQQTRRIEEELKESLSALQGSNRLVELLKPDLLRSRVIIWDGGTELTASSLRLLVRDDDALQAGGPAASFAQYDWDSREQCVIRTTTGLEGKRYSLPVLYRGPIDFELVLAESKVGSPKGATQGMYLARGIRIRAVGPAGLGGRVLAAQDSAASIATLPLPVPIRVVLPEEVSL